MAVKNNIFTMKAVNDETTSALFSQLGNLLGVGKRGDGRYYLADLCQATSINKWAKCKPFRNSAWNFASAADRDAARKAANQGLLLPTPKNAGVSSQHSYGYRYLGYLAYLISSGAIQSYPLQLPRGVTSTYTEPNRLRDFDGYDKTAVQPFTTGCTFIYADGTQKAYTSGMELNRFKVKSVRFWIQMANGNVQISLSDLLYGTSGTQFYFHAEQYKDIKSIQNEFFTRTPDVCKKSSKNITQIPVDYGFDSIDFDLEAEGDNTNWTAVIGINKYTSPDDAIPANEGLGFVAPWTSSNRPYIFTFNQTHHAVLNGSAYQGYYLPSGSSTWTAFNIPSTTQKNTGSDRVGMSIKLKKGNTGYYIVGTAQPSGIPSGATKYMFRMIYQGPTSRAIVGTVVDSNISSTPSNNLAYINPSGATEQTVYLRFDNILAAVGEELKYGILQISADGGTTWDYVKNEEDNRDWSSVGMSIKRV